MASHSYIIIKKNLFNKVYEYRCNDLKMLKYLLFHIKHKLEVQSSFNLVQLYSPKSMKITIDGRIGLLSQPQNT